MVPWRSIISSVRAHGPLNQEGLDLATHVSPFEPIPWSQADHQRLAAVRRLLTERVHTVAIWLDNTPNLGHQSATTVLIENLSRLGFRGHIEIRAQSRRHFEKLNVLWPQASQPNGQGVQKEFVVSGLRVTTTSVEAERCWSGCNPFGWFTGKQPAEPPSPRGRVGILAADDRSFLEGRQAQLCQDLRCEALLTLQPFQWDRPRVLTVGSRHTLLTSKSIPRDACFQYELPSALPRSRPELEAWVAQHLWTIPASLSGAARTLCDLLDATRCRSIDLMVVYGLHHPFVAPDTRQILFNITQALEALALRDPQARPVVVLLVGPSNRPYLLDNLPCQARCLWLDDPVFRQGISLNHLAHQSQLFVRTGVLSRPLFELCCRYARPPLLIEGANCANLALMLNKPYLSIRSDIVNDQARSTNYPQRFPADTTKDPQALRLGKISDHLALSSASGSLGLARLMVDLSDPRSAPSLYFQDAGRLAHSPAYDQLVVGLDLLRQALQ